MFVRKRIPESVCAGTSPRSGLEALPLINVCVQGKQFKALVDTGCSKSVLSPKVCKSWKKIRQYVVTVDGSQLPCVGKVTTPLSIDGCAIKVNCLVAESIFGDIDVVVGMDVVKMLGGVLVTGDSVVFLNTCDNRTLVDKVLNCSGEGVEKVSDVNVKTSFDGKVNAVAVAGVLEKGIT